MQKVIARFALRALRDQLPKASAEDRERIERVIDAKVKSATSVAAIMARLDDDPFAGPWLRNYVSTLRFEHEHLNRKALPRETVGFLVQPPPGEGQIITVPSLLCPACGRNYYGFSRGQRCPKDKTLLVQP